MSVAIEIVDHDDELSAIREELERQERSRDKKAARAPRGFDPAAMFLLNLSYENLFDPVDRDGCKYRCKGCGDTVLRLKRKQHHAAHKRNATKGESMASKSKATNGKAEQNRLQREQKAARDELATLEAKVAAEEELTEEETARLTELREAEFKGTTPTSNETSESETTTTPEPKPARGDKTAKAIDSAVAVLKEKGGALDVTAIMADPSMVDVNRGTLIVMLSKELRVAAPRIKRVGKGTYEAI